MILAELNCLQVLLIFLNKPTIILGDLYLDDFKKMAIYFTTLRQLPQKTIKKFNVFKKKAIKFKVEGNLLFCRNNKNISVRQVINDFIEKHTIL